MNNGETWEDMRKLLEQRSQLTGLPDETYWDWKWSSPGGGIAGVTICVDSNDICWYLEKTQSPLDSGAIHVSYVDFMTKGQPFHLIASTPWHVLTQLFDTVRYLQKHQSSL